MTGLTIDVEWSYGAGDSINSNTNFEAVEGAGVNANVCVDMFLAPDKSDSLSTKVSTFEVMVWLGRFGAATDPLGFDVGSLETKTIGGTTL